jgi:hypothetical protein
VVTDTTSDEAMVTAWRNYALGCVKRKEEIVLHEPDPANGTRTIAVRYTYYPSGWRGYRGTRAFPYAQEVVRDRSDDDLVAAIERVTRDRAHDAMNTMKRMKEDRT